MKVTVVQAKHRKYGKVLYFDPQGKDYQKGDLVILEADKNKDYGSIIIGNHETDIDKDLNTLPKIIRTINSFDEKKIEENSSREKKAFAFCKEKIKENKLEMNLVSVEYSFDRKKLKFYFTATKKVDFRSLVKLLVSEFRTGVELRQIGVRDASKILGAIGICGRKVCCHSFLNEFQAVNLKSARNQNILSSPDKISGICSRLRCCLLYEENHYKKCKSCKK